MPPLDPWPTQVRALAPLVWRPATRSCSPALRRVRRDCSLLSRQVPAVRRLASLFEPIVRHLQGPLLRRSRAKSRVSTASRWQLRGRWGLGSPLRLQKAPQRVSRSRGPLGLGSPLRPQQISPPLAQAAW
jgi:hypothetical protein